MQVHMRTLHNGDSERGIFPAPLRAPEAAGQMQACKHEHASRQHTCARKSRQRRADGFELSPANLFSNVNLRKRVTNPNTASQPHYASRRAGGRGHVGVPHSQAAADTTQHQLWTWTQSMQTWSMGGAETRALRMKIDAGRASLALAATAAAHPKPLALLGETSTNCNPQ